MKEKHTCGQCENYQPRSIYVPGHHERDGVHYNQEVPGSRWVEGRMVMRTKEETDEGICTAATPQWVWFHTPLLANEVMSSTETLGCKLFKPAEKSPSILPVSSGCPKSLWRGYNDL